MTSKFTELCFDCRDSEGLATFWADVLGYEVKQDEGYAYIENPKDQGPLILFLPVPEGKTVKNRLHIDVNPTDRDLAEEVQRLESLGATKADIGQGEVSWVVMRDPEGNEFCVLRGRVDP